jgi:hypothetical protein
MSKRFRTKAELVEFMLNRAVAENEDTDGWDPRAEIIEFSGETLVASFVAGACYTHSVTVIVAAVEQDHSVSFTLHFSGSKILDGYNPTEDQIRFEAYDRISFALGSLSI